MSELDIKYNPTDFIVIKSKVVQVECPECKCAGKIIDYYSVFRKGVEPVASYKTCELCRGAGKVNGPAK